MSTTADGAQHAFLWARGTMRDLGTFEEGFFSSAIGINTSRQIVGVSNHTGGFDDSSAALWSAGSIRDLGGEYSIARAINQHGQIVGEGRSASGLFHAMMWQGGRLKTLAMVPGASSSRAWDINDSGKVVGESLDSSFVPTAVVWTKRRR